MVFIDCGASYNFISSSLISEMGLALTTIGEFGVTMGTGEQIRSTGVCKQLCLHLPRVDIVSDFFPLPLAKIDLILGYEWLLSLGATHMNWKELTMKFSVEGSEFNCVMDLSLCKTQVSQQAMQRTLLCEKHGIMLECRQVSLASIEPSSSANMPLSIEISTLLEEYQDLLELFVGLPPIRDQELAITLNRDRFMVSAQGHSKVGGRKATHFTTNLLN